MIASSESPSSQADPSSVALVAAALAIAVFIVTWTLLHQGFYGRSEITDVPVYEHYGDAVADGQVPYRDFALEYPPAALPVFVAPSLGNGGDSGAYERVFGASMWICGALALLFCAIALRALRAPPLRLALALAFVALAPLALGSVVRLRFDLWPAALSVGALAALVAGRRLLSFAAFGVAVAAKLYPAVLVPLAVAYVWRRDGARAARAALAVLAATLAVCFVPFFALAPDGVVDSITRQTSRPLQIESLGSAFLLAAHHLFGAHLTMVSSHGSQNLSGTAADTLATAQTVLQALVLVALWVAFARGPATGERLVRYAAAAVCAFVAFGKVLSPQFLIWLVPLVPLVRGRRGVAASALLGVLLVLTQLWFPYRYWDLAVHFGATESWLLLARDLGLLALLGVLAYGTATRTESHALARPS